VLFSLAVEQKAAIGDLVLGLRLKNMAWLAEASSGRRAAPGSGTYRFSAIPSNVDRCIRSASAVTT
jgi:hypothetical protein